MVTIQIDDPALVLRLLEIANREQKTVEEILKRLVQAYDPLPPFTEADLARQRAALAASAGMFKDDITDISATVDETVRAYIEKKHGSVG